MTEEIKNQAGEEAGAVQEITRSVDGKKIPINELDKYTIIENDKYTKNQSELQEKAKYAETLDAMLKADSDLDEIFQKHFVKGEPVKKVPSNEIEEDDGTEVKLPKAVQARLDKMEELLNKSINNTQQLEKKDQLKEFNKLTDNLVVKYPMLDKDAFSFKVANYRGANIDMDSIAKEIHENELNKFNDYAEKNGLKKAEEKEEKDEFGGGGDPGKHEEKKEKFNLARPGDHMKAIRTAIANLKK